MIQVVFLDSGGLGDIINPGFKPEVMQKKSSFLYSKPLYSSIKRWIQFILEQKIAIGKIDRKHYNYIISKKRG